MIVVVGTLAWRPGADARPAGRAAGIALAAAGRGARVELIARVGEDPEGEALLLALAMAGVGHAAVLRDPRPTPVESSAGAIDDEDAAALIGDSGPAPTLIAVSTRDEAGPRLDAADVELGVRYLEPSGVLVVADGLPDDVVGAAVEAAGYAGTRLVVLVGESATGSRGLPGGLPADATVLAAPDDDDGSFDRIVGVYAAMLDAGADPAAAFAEAQRATGWEPAAAD